MNSDLINNSNEKTYKLQFSNCTRHYHDEGLSKLLSPYSELTKRLFNDREKLKTSFGNSIEKKVADFHVELLKPSDNQSMVQLTNRCHSLTNAPVSYKKENFKVMGNKLVLETPNVEGYGKTNIALAEFNTQVPSNAIDVLFGGSVGTNVGNSLPPVPTLPAYPIHSDYNATTNSVHYNAPSHLPQYPTNPAFPINPKYLSGGSMFDKLSYDAEQSTTDFSEQVGGNMSLPPMPSNPSYPIGSEYLQNTKNIYGFQYQPTVNYKNDMPPIPSRPAYPIHPDYVQ